MKKAFCFSLIVMFLALAGLTPVKADDIVVNGSYTDTDTLSQSDYNDLTNSALLLKYLQNGGVIDTSNVSNNYTASDLITDFGNFVKEVVPNLIDFINPFQSKFEYTPLGSSMLNNNIYQFMGMLPFYTLQEPDSPDVTPDNNYSYLLDIINGSGFFWKHYNINYTSNDRPLNTFNVQNVSWVRTNYVVDQQCYPSDIVTIYLNGDDVNHWTCLYSGNNMSYYTSVDVNDNYRLVYNPYSNTNTLNSSVIAKAFYGPNFWSDGYLNRTYNNFNTLYDALSFITSWYRNVNIYVNNELWAYAGGINQTYSLDISNGTTIATNDYGYVHWVYDYEIFFRIDRLWDLVDDILYEIRNPSDSNNPRTSVITWTDLEDVIYDVDGNKAIGVKILEDKRNIDDLYISTYGPIIPGFLPLFTPVIDDIDIITIADTAVSPIPSDLLEVFGYMFMGVLFVGFIHRLLE